MAAIDLRTKIPGPRSQALLERRQRSVTRGLATAHPLFIESGRGATLTDVDGNTFIDFTGGIGAMNVGHARSELVEAAYAQGQRLTHTAIQVNGYAAYVELAERLCAIAPIAGEKRAFVVTTGTEACENAVKFARAFSKRPAVVVFEHAFHGRSLGGLSFTSRYTPYKNDFGPFLPEVYRLPYPTWYRNGQTPEQALDDAKRRIADFFKATIAPSAVAAIMIETVLGEGGFLVPPPGFLPYLRALATEHGIQLIIDEVQCGMARTGKLFAIEHFGVEPDLLTVAKSVAGGFPVAAVVGRAPIMDAVGPGAMGGTYAGNPMSCAAALATLDIIEREKLVERSTALGEQLHARLSALADKHPVIGDVRGLGAMMAIELVTDRKTRVPAGETVAKLVQDAREHGLLLLATGTYANVIRLLMPLVITPTELDEAFAVLDGALARSV